MLTMARLKIWMGVSYGPAINPYTLEAFFPITSLRWSSFPLNSMLLSDSFNEYSPLSWACSSSPSRAVAMYLTEWLGISLQTCLRDGESSVLATLSCGQQSTKFLLFLRVRVQTMVPRRQSVALWVSSMLNSVRSRLETRVQVWQYWQQCQRQVTISQQVRLGRMALLAFIRHLLPGPMCHSQKDFQRKELQTWTQNLWAVRAGKGRNISSRILSQSVMLLRMSEKYVLRMITSGARFKRLGQDDSGSGLRRSVGSMRGAYGGDVGGGLLTASVSAFESQDSESQKMSVLGTYCAIYLYLCLLLISGLGGGLLASLISCIYYGYFKSYFFLLCSHTACPFYSRLAFVLARPLSLLVVLLIFVDEGRQQSVQSAGNDCMREGRRIVDSTLHDYLEYLVVRMGSFVESSLTVWHSLSWVPSSPSSSSLEQKIRFAAFLLCVLEMAWRIWSLCGLLIGLIIAMVLFY